LRGQYSFIPKALVMLLGITNFYLYIMYNIYDVNDFNPVLTAGLR